MDLARSLDVKGLSVTIPFKQDVMALVDEVDEHAAQQIGAVNTVVFACGLVDRLQHRLARRAQAAGLPQGVQGRAARGRRGRLGSRLCAHRTWRWM